ncbi:MAG: magnesium transporter [Magnetococcales bacterium]|nr:magnesium transporter [Magnetococcales bacterium]
MRGMLQLDAKEREIILTLAEPASAAEIIVDMPNNLAADLMSSLQPEDAATILEELSVENQADIMSELGDKEADLIYNQMTNLEQVEIVRQISSYAKGSAGDLMSTKSFTVKSSETVGGVLRRLGSEEDELDHYRGQFYPYVVDENNRLLGVLSILHMLQEKRASLVTDIIIKPVSVQVETTLDELNRLFTENSFFNLPVVDEQGILLGIISRADVEKAIHEGVELDSLKSSGVLEDELRSMPLLLRSRRRLSWLSANIVLNIIAASVISSYEETLTAVIAIAVFLPMVSDMSGCSGNQAVAVSMRELSLGILKPIDMAHVWFKEVMVGVINGTVLGILIGLVAWGWKGNPYLGLVIGLALAINTVIAVSIGGTVPLLLKRFGVDPAVASGPLLTTVTDMAGFFLVLSLATLMMPLLT